MQLDSVYTVRASDILLAMANFEYDIRKYHESVVGGDWDVRAIPFENSVPGMLYRSLGQMSHGTKWEGTEYWHFLQSSLTKGICHCGVKTPADLKNRCYYWMNKLVAETKSMGRIPTWANERDLIGVNIGRSGQLILNNGRHRFGVAKFFNVDSIPVSVTVRHPLWATFRDDVLKYAAQHHGIYAPIDHMDFQGVPSYHGVDRIDAIGESIASECKTVLDVGAHWGHCCSYLSKRGLCCTAVENSSVALHFLRKLRDACLFTFEIVEHSVFDMGKVHYDVVLALRIFHHFLKTRDSFDKLIQLLQRLSMREMYFQPHDIHVQDMAGAYQNFDTVRFLDFLRHYSCLDKVEKVGDFVGGPVFKLWH